MDNNKPIVTIDKKWEKKANKEFSHFFKEKILIFFTIIKIQFLLKIILIHTHMMRFTVGIKAVR